LDHVTVALMLLASLLHASWHGLVKSSGAQLTTLAGMGLVASVGAALLLPFLPLPAPAVWPVLIGSVALHVSYKLCLASAYSRGDLGQAFPLARGMVPLFAAILAFALLGQAPTRGQGLGIVLVSAGVLVLTAGKLSGRINGPLLLATTGAGIAVACYSVVDAYGTRLAGNWAAFTAWLIILDNLTFLAVCRVISGDRFWRDLAALKARIVVTGVLGLLSFGVFLWALSQSPAGPVSALRESSVLFAFLIGIVAHREAFSLARLAGAALIVLGVVVIAL
jgi:drug/metabolite transporter (DMT)-like permease